MLNASVLAVARQSVAVLARRQSVGDARVARFASEDSSSLTNAVASLTEGSRGVPLQVVLADLLVKLFIVDPPLGLTRFSDLQAATALRFEELFGLDAAAWRISAEWSARRRFIACAAPAWRLAALEASRCRLVRVEPAFVHCYNAMSSSEPLQWLVCRYPDSVTAAFFDGLGCGLVRSSALESDESVNAWLEREALLANQPLRRVLLMTAATSASEIAHGSVEARLAQPPRAMQLLHSLHADEPALA